MKILVVSNGFPPRGIWGTEFYTHGLVHGLRGRGHDVSVLHPDRDPSRPRYGIDVVEEDGVRVHLLANPGDPSKRFAPSYEDERVEEAFRDLLSRERPDLVHFTYLLWGLSVRLPAVAKGLGIPSVVTLTDYNLLCHRGQLFDHALERCSGPETPAKCARCIREPAPYDQGTAGRALRRLAVRALAAGGGFGKVVTDADLARREEVVRAALDDVTRFVAPTATLARTFTDWGLDAARIDRLVYSFPDEDYVAARDLPAPATPRLGFPAQLAPHKGFDTLVDAVTLLAERRPDLGEWEVVLYGGTSGARHRHFPGAVLARADRNRVREGAPFLPPDAPRVYAGLSAVVLPSRWDENAPLSILQARAVGVPVVGTNVGGIAEVVEDGVHGRLVPPDDPPALSRAMEEVVEGRIGRLDTPGLPLSLADHLDAIEGIHRAAQGGT